MIKKTWHYMVIAFLFLIIFTLSFNSKKVSVWYLMTFNDLTSTNNEVNEMYLGEEMTITVDSIIPKLKNNQKYSAATIENLPDKFFSPPYLALNKININEKGKFELDSASTRKIWDNINQSLLFRVKLVIYCDHGLLKEKVAKNHQEFEFVNLPLVINKKITLENGEKVYKAINYQKPLRLKLGYKYLFADGKIGYIDRYGNYYEFDKADDSCTILTNTFDIKIASFKSKAAILSGK